jgi:hypothetical protein
VDSLIRDMEASIAESEVFIRQFHQGILQPGAMRDAAFFWPALSKKSETALGQLTKVWLILCRQSR